MDACCKVLESGGGAFVTIEPIVVSQAELDERGRRSLCRLEDESRKKS